MFALSDRALVEICCPPISHVPSYPEFLTSQQISSREVGDAGDVASV
jgi:hypothetical protein